MCGRYAASRKPEDLTSVFDVQKWEPAEALAPDYNVAPTKDVYVVLDRPVKDSGSPDPVRQLRVLRWGLVPSWAKSPDVAFKMINARAETAAEKPSYRRALASRRCLIPADGYYEWMTDAAERELEEKGRRKRSRKQPYFVTPADGSVFAMAGLYEFWRDRTLPDDHPRAWWTTCTVMTTAAETTALAGYDGHGPRALADIHPRMPLMMPRDRWDAWLDPATTDTDAVQHLLEPPPPGLLRAYPVGTAVSNVANNGPELLTELEGPEEETLF
ncbi:SOS response-associated peptidase [Actinacidiphila epipremni]|jgi:putative SOS response-associated peptidase YedK|uniref:Abasic site processing protein n=1 Tax=Actinacidiphila epipremni TaxID=2053013 RepID=A0ABX0ZL50_9ACTN|nr:SOS response-associated peptidase [Actinacidiphila epipremni]NJP42391.1 SOS response-associated peptidase [Actinacidiphila epipremni]